MVKFFFRSVECNELSGYGNESKVKKEKNNFLLSTGNIFYCKSITKCNYDKDQGLEDICCLLIRLICPGLFASIVPLHVASTQI